MIIPYDIVEKMEIFFGFYPTSNTMFQYTEHALSNPTILRTLTSFSSKKDYKFCTKELHNQCDKLNLICEYDTLNEIYQFSAKNPYGYNANYEPIFRFMKKVHTNKLTQ